MPVHPPETALQHWVWITRPEYYAEEDGSDREDLDPSIQSDAGDWWSCHKNTRRGDLVLLYRTKPRADLKYLIRAESDAYSIADDQHAAAQGWDYGCDYRIVYKFGSALTLADLRSDPYLEEWGALSGNFQRRVYAIPTVIWERLVTRIIEREPSAKTFLMPRVIHPPYRMKRSLKTGLHQTHQSYAVSATIWRCESVSGCVRGTVGALICSAMTVGASAMW